MALNVLVVIGTRPEAIKMVPVILSLRKDDRITSRLCVTAQHRQMLDQVLKVFDIKPDFDLDIMREGQDLTDVTCSVLAGLRDLFRTDKPDVVLVHGDTTTCLAATLCAFYAGVPVCHVEAGLRTGDVHAPFPEEANRVLVSKLVSLHFAPTNSAKRNLVQERVPESKISVTGNTVIDTLLLARDRISGLPQDTWREFVGEKSMKAIQFANRLILVTGHRRENFGAGFESLCTAIADIADRHADWLIIYPVHLNPKVQEPVHRILGSFPNIHLLPPQEYLPFVWLMMQADLILTDSGGIQEEAPALGVPVLVMREVTERPEAVEAGTVELVGTDRRRITAAVEGVLGDAGRYEKMKSAINPYGDGQASERIVSRLLEEFFT